MPFTRRDLCALLPAALLPGGLAAQVVAAAQGTAPEVERSDPPLIPSGAYPWNSLVPHKDRTGSSVTRAIFRGNLATGESVEVHETTLEVGAAPHPPHRHLHSEMFLVREGTIEFTVNDKSTRIGPGSTGFAASNEMHGVRNPGGTSTTYFVVAIGPGAM